jgi:hypothetical protein
MGSGDVDDGAVVRRPRPVKADTAQGNTRSPSAPPPSPPPLEARSWITADLTGTAAKKKDAWLGEPRSAALGIPGRSARRRDARSGARRAWCARSNRRPARAIAEAPRSPGIARRWRGRPAQNVTSVIDASGPKPAEETAAGPGRAACRQRRRLTRCPPGAPAIRLRPARSDPSPASNSASAYAQRQPGHRGARRGSPPSGRSGQAGQRPPPSAGEHRRAGRGSASGAPWPAGSPSRRWSASGA